MIRVEAASLTDDSDIYFDLVEKLLGELSDEPGEFDPIDRSKVLALIQQNPDGFNAFLAINSEGEAVGAITLVESFAIYAGGHFGVICELYVAPAYRSQGVGKKLLDAVKAGARERGWKRIDVTAPPEEKWVPTVKFYERAGFVFTGPKMRYSVS